MIDFRLEKGMVLCRMSTQEMASVMADGGLINVIYKQWLTDIRRQLKQDRTLASTKPIATILHEKDGLVHVLRCKLDSWKYFREVEAVNPTERQIRSYMLQLGELGMADEAARISSV
jgi:hypothetical protein